MFKFSFWEFLIINPFGVKQSYETCFPELTDEDSEAEGINILAKEHVNGNFRILDSIFDGIA